MELSQGPATKADIQVLELATKTEIQILRQELASKADLRTLGAELNHKSGKVAADQENSRLKMEERLVGQYNHLKSDIFDKLDFVLDKLLTFDRESVSIPKTLDEHGRKLRDHERRLKNLESTIH